MAEPLADQILRNLPHAAELYHRLILVVASPGMGKTAALREVRERTGAPLLDTNLELSRRMLELAERQRALQAPRLMAEIIGPAVGRVVLLDNTELLFDVSLKQDPLRLLLSLSRNTTIVAAWSGRVDSEYLYYAAAGHPEYRRYRLGECVVISPEHPI